MEIFNLRLQSAKDALIKAQGNDFLFSRMSAMHSSAVISSLRPFEEGLTIEEKMDLSDEVLKTNWHGTDGERILQVLLRENTVAAAHGGSRERQPYQNYLNVVDMWTEEEWKNLESSNVRCAVELLVLKVGTLGGRSLDEKSKKHLVCFLFAATGAEDLSFENKASIRKTFNLRLTAMKRKCRASLTTYIQVLPSPTELRDKYPDVYAMAFPDAEPVKCQLPNNKWLFESDVMATRPKSQQVALVNTAPDAGNHPMMQMGMFMVQSMQQMQAGQQKMFDMMMNGNPSQKLGLIQNAAASASSTTPLKRCFTFEEPRKADGSPSEEGSPNQKRMDMGTAKEKSMKAAPFALTNSPANPAATSTAGHVAERKRRLEHIRRVNERLSRETDEGRTATTPKWSSGARGGVGDVIQSLVSERCKKKEEVKKAFKADMKKAEVFRAAEKTAEVLKAAEKTAIELSATSPKHADLRSALGTAKASATPPKHAHLRSALGTAKASATPPEQADLRSASGTAKASATPPKHAHLRSALGTAKASATPPKHADLRSASGHKSRKPTVSHEQSRSQWLLRTGLAGPGQSFALKYGKGQRFSDQAAARKQAEAWKSTGARDFICLV